VLPIEKRIDIRWRDLDALGHVNNAVYLTYAEEVLDAWFRERLDLGEGEVWEYVNARIAIDFVSELRQTDVHVVGTARLLRVGAKSVTAAIELRARDGRLAANVETVAVALAGRGGPSRAVSPEERAALGG
jgi:acyl-CoA thioester hydrolase